MDPGISFTNITGVEQVRISTYLVHRDGPACEQNSKLCSGEGGFWCCALGANCGSSSLCVMHTSTAVSCETGSFLCPPEEGSGCCEVGQRCSRSLCVLDVTATSNIPHNGSSIIVSTVTVSQKPTSSIPASQQPGPTSQTSDSSLTKADIGGIVGGVLGFFVALGLIAWLFMRRLNEITRFVKARLGPEKDVDVDGKESHDVRIVQEHPAEVWDPHSQGMPLGIRRELTGSYEAHGVSEMEENPPISEMDGTDLTGEKELFHLASYQAHGPALGME